MGHSSVTTTEVYLNMDLKRVKQDFPTIVSSYPESPKSLIRDTKNYKQKTPTTAGLLLKVLWDLLLQITPDAIRIYCLMLH